MMIGAYAAVIRRSTIRGRAFVARMWMHVRSSPRTSAAFVIYAALIAIVTPPAVTWYIRLSFFVNAGIIFWVVWQHQSTEERGGAPDAPQRKKVFVILMLIGGVFLLCSRLLPFLRYGEAPLGYDTGFYLSSMDGFLARILSGGGARNFRTLIWVPLDWLKIPPIVYLHAMYVAAQFFVVGAMYVLARTLAPRQRIEYAAASVFLFATSIPQFFAYWWMFYQTEFAIAFLLLSIALFHRRSWFALLTMLMGTLIHPATFLPFLIAIAIHIAIQLIYSLIQMRPLNRDTSFLLLLVAFAVVVVQLRVGDSRTFYLEYVYGPIGEYGWLYTKYPFYLQPSFSGLFVNRTIVHLANIYLLPFAILGVVLFAFRRLRLQDGAQSSRTAFLLIWMAVLVVLVSIPVVYQHRFLIYLDLVLILFAAHALVRFLCAMWRDRANMLVVLLLLFGFTLHGSLAVWNQKPQVFPDELAEIREIAKIAEASAYAMVTESLYTPWLSAFSGRPVIDPGFGALNKWPYDLWEEFWNGESDARRHELLSMYDRPLYVFTGRSVRSNAKYMRFIQNDSSFVRISPHVWRYDPQIITADDIEALRLLERSS